MAFTSKYLLYTNVCISFTLSGVGDAIQQQYEIVQSNLCEWDKGRTKKMAITGFSVGILCHYYYAFLDRRLPGKSMKILAKKVLIDQLICSPICITGFLLTIALLDGVTFKQFVQDLRRKGVRLYTADWIVWPPAQIINFYFVPPRYRVLYDSMISLGYDVYTSYVNFDESDS